MKLVCVIPARYKSKRLPGKPLKKILGVPMILRTVNRCLKVIKRENLFVATDDSRILNLCKKNRINTVLIKKKCLTGTDRVAQFAKIKNFSNYINVQGDEPILNTKDLKKIISYTKRNPNQVYGGYCKIKNKIDYKNPSIPKVIFDKNKSLFYMSRASIPSNKNLEFIKGYKQIGIYSFPKKALKKFNSVGKKTALEKMEDIELLRFLEMGINVKMIEMSDKSISVDLPKDIKKVTNILKRTKK